MGKKLNAYNEIQKIWLQAADTTSSSRPGSNLIETNDRAM